MIKPSSSINHFLNEVNNKIRLSDFIGQFVNLIEKGNSHVGKCPFHNEKTPSFNVNNDKSLFYCFGCKTGGNILNFITKYKNLSFLEAIDYISKYSGISYYIDEKKKPLNSDEKLIFQILKYTNDFFQLSLNNSKQVIKYLRERGLSNEEIKTFNLGFCPDEKYLINFLQEKGFDTEKIKKTDLLIKNKSNEYFGRFRNRITFPIFDFSNKLVGFGGRTIGVSKIKYINSQESVVFKKSQILFGLSQNVDYIRKEKEIFLVEGYMDVIRLFSFGIKNAVSSLGTTLSELQLRKLWNFSSLPYICFDGDEAGINASKKVALKVLKFLKPGKSLKFITIPGQADPDSFLEGKKKSDFTDLKNQSLDLSTVIWEIIKESITTDTPEFLASIDQKITSIIKSIDDSKVSAEYFRFLKAKKDGFIWNINKNQSISYKEKKAESVFENLNEKIFILMILLNNNYLSEFNEEIFEVKLSDEILKKEMKEILRAYTEKKNSFVLIVDSYKGKNPAFYHEMQELQKTHLDNLTIREKNKLFRQILNNLRLPVLLDERKSIQKEIIDEKNTEISNNLLKKYSRISEEIKIIQNKDIE